MTAPPDALAAIRALCIEAGMQEPSTEIDYLRGVFYQLRQVLAQVERSEQETKQEREGRLTALAELAGSRLLRMEWQEKATKLEQARDSAKDELVIALTERNDIGRRYEREMERADRAEQARDAARAALKGVAVQMRSPNNRLLNLVAGPILDQWANELDAFLDPAPAAEGDDTGDGGTPLQQPR